jgi:hypothetical protein
LSDVEPGRRIATFNACAEAAVAIDKAAAPAMRPSSPIFSVLIDIPVTPDLFR